MDTTNEDGLWDVQDVSRFLKLKPFTVRKKVRQGALPALRVGRLMRFVPSEIRKKFRGQGN